MTLGDYEISISAGCSGYVNISNSATLEHRPGELSHPPCKTLSCSGSISTPQTVPGCELAVHMGQGPLPTDRLNGSILHSKVGELQSVFPWAIWSQDQRTVLGTFHVLVLQSTSKSLWEGKPISTARGVRKYCNAFSSPMCLQSCVTFTNDLCWNMQKTLGYSTIPVKSILQDPYKEAVRLTLKQTTLREKKLFSPSLSGLSCR